MRKAYSANKGCKERRIRWVKKAVGLLCFLGVGFLFAWVDVRVFAGILLFMIGTGFYEGDL